MTTRFSRAKAFAVGAVAILLGVLYAPMQTAAQNAVLVFGSSSGAVQVIKATSNALWVSLQGGPFTGQLTAPAGCTTIPYSFQGRTTTGMCSPSATELSFYVANVQQLRLTSSGEVFATTNVALAANTGAFYWLSRAVIRSPADGVVSLANNAETGFTRLILGTNDATTNGASWNLNAGVLEAKTGDGSTFSNVKTAGIVGSGGNFVLANTSGKITTYNGVTTAGWGTPAIQALATTGTVTNSGTASIAAYTNGAADGIFRVSCDVSITVSTAHSFSCDVTYTDATNAARTMVLPMNALAGTFITSGLMTNVTGVGPYESATMQIRAKASTTITVRTSSGGTFTTVTYTASGSIVQVG